MTRPTRKLTGPEPLEARDQPAATLLADVNPVGTSALRPDTWLPALSGAAATKSTVVFRADTGTQTGLWATDGSPTGAVFLGVNPRFGGDNLDPVAVGDKVFFMEAAPAGGYALWATDSTRAGTRVVKPLTAPTGPAGGMTFHDAAAAGGRFVMAADTWGEAGPTAHLYGSDGTAAGTQVIADPPWGLGTRFVTDGQTAYYAVNRHNDGGTDTATIYRTDGTKAGTRAFVTLPAGTAVHVYSRFFPAWGGTVGSRFVFMADNEATGRELWVSDGTRAGTRMLKDIDPRTAKPASTAPTFLPMPDGSVLKIPPPGPKGFGSDPQQFTRLGGVQYFVADDGVHGQELWRTDGTPAGTRMVVDLSPTVGSNPTVEPDQTGKLLPSGSRIANLTAVGGRLYFSADDGRRGSQLYVSDGTPAGTRALTAVHQMAPFRGANGLAFPLDEPPFVLAAVGGKVLFSLGSVPDGRQLWATDGTPAGTGPVKAVGRVGGPIPRELIGPVALGVRNGRLIFSADDGLTGRQLYTTDGTAAGTRLLQRLTTGTLGSNPREFVAVGPKAFFIADDTARSTAVLATDGQGPPAAVKRFVGPDTGIPLTYSALDRPARLTAWDGKAAFVTRTLNFDRQLWVTDGTAPGTRLVKEFALPKGFSAANHPSPLGIDNLTPFRGALYFTADVPGTGQQLWKTDGTAAGTTPVKLLSMASATAWSTAESMGPVRHLTVVGDRLFFAANDNVHGEELWVSDGTAAGTRMVADLHPKSPADLPVKNGGSRPRDLVAFNGRLYFQARTDPAGTRQLMVSDGTAAGTKAVARIYEEVPQGDSIGGPKALGMVAAGGRLFFTGQDKANGYQLWTSDGTAAGTRRLTDTRTLPRDTIPEELRVVGKKVYFTAYTPLDGRQLWVSDGTPAGTRLARPIGSASDVPPNTDPTRGGANPTVLAVVGDRVYFAARNPELGRELWVTDGTAAGTRLAKDFTVGKANGLGDSWGGWASSSAAVVGDRLILGVTDPARGAEPWSIRLGELG